MDVATGEPLFHQRISLSLVVAGPSFTQPISPDVATYKEDKSYNMTRMEVRSRVGDSPWPCLYGRPTGQGWLALLYQ